MLPNSSRTPNLQCQISNMLQKKGKRGAWGGGGEGGGSTNLSKGAAKHGGIVKQQGAIRYLDKGVGKHDEATKQG